MKTQTRLMITMSPEAGNDTTLTYNNGLVTAIFSPGKNHSVTGIDSFYFYNDELMLLDYGSRETHNMDRNGRSLKLTFCEPRIWLPGHYFLLLHYSSEEVLRFDVTLDDHATFHCGEPSKYGFMSKENLLSEVLCEKVRYWEWLTMRPGLRQFREKAIERAHLLALNKFRSVLITSGNIECCNNFIITMQDYSMIHQAVNMFRCVTQLHMELKWIKCSELYDPTNNNPYEKLNELFADESSSDNCLNLELHSGKSYLYCITQLSALLDNGGKQILKKLRQHWSNVVLIGTQAEVSNLLEQNPSLRDLFPAENHLSIEPFSRAEIIHWLFFRASIKYHLPFSPKAKDCICRLLTEAYDKGAVRQWTLEDIDCYIEKHIQPHYCERLLERLKGREIDLSEVTIQPEDIEEQPLFERTTSYDSTLEELNGMVGLSDIKQSLTTIANNMHLAVERQQLGLPTSGKTQHHAIFMGNPGTGKTTVARLLGKIYHSLGLLSKGDVITVDRTRIIGRYIGETEENMKQILHEAQGNVLFVDEAYTLYGNESGNDFGRRAVECLLSVLTQKNPDMLIIFAGYQNEMDRLMSMNPGLVGRFPYKFLFKDYSADELMQIVRTLLAHDEYLLSSEAERLLQQAIRETVAQKNKNFGNARWIEQFVNNGIIPALANRLATTSHPFTREVYQRIEASDVQRAFELFNPKTIELKPHRQVGFSA